MNLYLRLGQNKKMIDPNDIYSLSAIGLTQAQIARKLNMRAETLSRRLNSSVELMRARHLGLQEFNKAANSRPER